MKPDSPSLAPESSRIPHHIWKVASLHLGNSKDSEIPVSSLEEHQFSTAIQGKLRAPHIMLRWELMRGTLSLLPQVDWILRCPDSKEAWISLQWLQWRLLFHLTRWRDVWIPCVDTGGSPVPTSSWQGASHLLTTREARGVQCFKRWQCLTFLENWY